MSKINPFEYLNNEKYDMWEKDLMYRSIGTYLMAK